MSKKSLRIELSPEQKKLAVDSIKKYFEAERDEQIGDLAATILLNALLESVGPTVYNKAVADVQRYMGERVDDLYGLML